MKKMWMLLLGSLPGLLLWTACNPAGGPPAAPIPTPSATPQAVAHDKELPTPVSPEQTIVYQDLEVVMRQAEITSSYINEYGSNREPPAGKNILWVHIALKNIGQPEKDLPAPEHFSVLNGTVEYKSIYGHRKDHTDYMTLTASLVQGQAVDAWLRFDIPAGLELKDLQFAFLPESSQVSTGFSSSDYSWGDHPIYLWMCAP